MNILGILILKIVILLTIICILLRYLIKVIKDKIIKL